MLLGFLYHVNPAVIQAARHLWLWMLQSYQSHIRPASLTSREPLASSIQARIKIFSPLFIAKDAKPLIQELHLLVSSLNLFLFLSALFAIII